MCVSLEYSKKNSWYFPSRNLTEQRRTRVANYIREIHLNLNLLICKLYGVANDNNTIIMVLKIIKAA